jgi:hypothetical protein
MQRQGLSRAELMRSIATEAVEAHDAGRLAFQIVDGPKLGWHAQCLGRAAA